MEEVDVSDKEWGLQCSKALAQCRGAVNDEQFCLDNEGEWAAAVGSPPDAAAYVIKYIEHLRTKLDKAEFLATEYGGIVDNQRYEISSLESRSERFDDALKIKGYVHAEYLSGSRIWHLGDTLAGRLLIYPISWSHGCIPVRVYIVPADTDTGD